MSNCQHITSLIATTDIKPDTLHISRIRCKQWTCTHCAAILKKQWQAVLLKQLPAISEQWSFHTFTMRPHVHKLKSEDDRAQRSAAVIRKYWDRLFKRVKRLYPDVQYVRVIEQHKSGALHVHLLLGSFVDDIRTVYDKHGNEKYQYSPSIRKLVVACQFGYMTSCYNLTGGAGGAVAYVSKYMTKADLTMALQLSSCKIRRIQTSRKIKFDTMPQQETKRKWNRIPAITIDDMLRIDVYDMDKKREVNMDDLQQTGYYPSDLWRD